MAALYMFCSMEDLPSFQTAPEMPPSDPLPDGASCLAGETVAARTELHVRTLRRFTELALDAAERMNRRGAGGGQRGPGGPTRRKPKRRAMRRRGWLRPARCRWHCSA